MPRDWATINKANKAFAIQDANRLGHNLVPFDTKVKLAGSLIPGLEAKCHNCGMTVGVYEGSYEIMGEAIALDCPTKGDK